MLGRDLIRYIPSKFIPALVTVISIPFYTRIFTAEEYGEYMLVINLVGFFSIVVGWMSMSITRYYPESEKNNTLKPFMGSILLLFVLSLVVLVVLYSSILLLFKEYISTELYKLSWLGLILLILTALFTLLQSVSRSKREVNVYSFSIVWKSLSTFIIALIIIYFFLNSVAAIIIAGILSLLLIVPFLIKKTIPREMTMNDLKVNRNIASEMFTYSYPLVLVNISAWFLSLSDRFMLEYFRDSHEVGIYSASYQVAEQSVMIIATLFMLAGRPILVRTWENEGKKSVQRFITKLTKYYLLLALPATVGISILAKPITTMVFGDEFIEGHKVLPYIVIGAFFLGLQQRFQDGFILEKRTISLFQTFLIASILNIILNWIFLPKYGFIAAGFTTMISYIFLMILMIIISKKTIRWGFPIKSLLNSLLSCILMSGFIWFLSKIIISELLFLISSIILGAFVYLIGLLTTGEIRKEKLVNFLYGFKK